MAHAGSPGQRAVKRACVRACVRGCVYWTRLCIDDVRASRMYEITIDLTLYQQSVVEVPVFLMLFI